jgi:hypothetical protein
MSEAMKSIEDVLGDFSGCRRLAFIFFGAAAEVGLDKFIGKSIYLEALLNATL